MKNQKVPYTLTGYISGNVHFWAIFVAVLIWSISFVATKIALTSFPPLLLGLVRFGLASMFLGSLPAIRKQIVVPDRKDLAKLALSGLMGITVYFSLENVGVKYSTAADAALIIASYPAITMSLEMLIYRTRFPMTSFIGVGMSAVGVYLIITAGGFVHSATDRLAGDVLLILAGFVWSVYNFITRGVVSRYSMTTITFYQVTAGAIGFLPLILLETDRWTVPKTDAVLAVTYLALFCSLTAFGLYAYGLRRVRSAHAVILMNMVPVFGVLFSFLILHEEIHLKQVTGGLITITGVLLSVLPPGSRR